MSQLDISKIDRNFAGEELKYEGIKLYDVRNGAFGLYGLYKPYEKDAFKRLPYDFAKKLNSSIQELYKHTSGGRIRFKTDSTRILVRSILPHIVQFDHMPKTGVSCFDLYIDGKYKNTFRHGFLHGLKEVELSEQMYDSNLTLGEKKMRDILIHFPLYNPVDNVFIGLDEDASIEPADEYTYKKTIVFYGSSITQGGCASHPGNSYVNIISRRLDTDVLNLGFSSGCIAETEMAEYISELDMSVFVYDYDHNAHSAEYLEKTHERAFKIIRNKRPELPIIIVSAADSVCGTEKRRDVIYQTYTNAIQAGDQNTYFVDGSKIYEEVGRDYCTVDDIHPNDVGFLMMANSIENVIEKIIN